ncbi:MAG TPA: hypothetical protein VK465_13840, partial [Fibrobacteria bacterium]|nr:hypothetical protein [Fibrobacteria bacterium]
DPDVAEEARAAADEAAGLGASIETLPEDLAEIGADAAVKEEDVAAALENEARGKAEAGETEAALDEEYEELGPLEDEGTSPSIEALRAISDPPKPKKVRKPKAAPAPAAAGPGPGELESGATPEEEGRFLRIIPGELTKKAADFAAGTLPGRPGQGPARLADLGWDEYLSKLVLLSWHIASGKALDLSLLKGGPELLETVAGQFAAPLKVDRNNVDEGDELARRIARQMRAAGKQEPTTRLRLNAPVKLKPQTYTVPADVTETAALCLAATLLKGSDITLEGVVLNPTRAGFLAALRRMGADIEVISRRERQGETLGTLRVRSADLLGKRFGADNLATMRDEVFLLMVAASFAEGETILRDIAHLRRHRHDLLKSFAGALKSAGVEIGEIEDGLVIRGRPDYDGTTYDCLGHPPLGLAGLVMALKSHGSSSLEGGACLSACYPGLLDQLASLAAPDRATEKGKGGRDAKGGSDVDEEENSDHGEDDEE